MNENEMMLMGTSIVGKSAEKKKEMNVPGSNG